MNVFKSEYYKINYYYLKLLGLWPNENHSRKKFKRITVIFLIVSLLIPQYIRLFEEWGRDVDIVIELIGSIFYFTGSQMKYMSFVRVESKMKFIFEEISRHWNTLTDAKEQKLLRENGRYGRIIALGYIIPINIILVVYITVPLAPAVLDIIDPLNESRPKAFPYFAEYFIDDQKYYFELTIHGWIVCILSVQIYATFDTTYQLCMQHVCALFSIVENRIREANKLSWRGNSDSDHKIQMRDRSYERMIQAVVLHKEAMRFIGLIEECYTFVYSYVVLANTLLLSLTAVDTMLNFEKGNFKQMIRLGMLYIGFSFHLLYNMNPGQNVIDSSVHIQEAAFHTNWYDSSSKTKQLLRIIMMRSWRPCKLTANGVVTLNLETFAFVFKKSISYVAVIGSVR
ncbi:odorant receptor 9a-like [Trichogramma pretiosum]|uniref:odorant receptor 9a-like n=1 Tax=Trichogramma pretiosum TaxID=7493 RepID=UPI0006C960A9|nr:odorant receptor 9a-like [Trichogramma pretiosum]